MSAAADLINLKAELKAWERAFRTEHGREPDKNDVKTDLVIGEFADSNV